MNIFKKFLELFKIKKPRYQLSLDSSYYHFNKQAIVYRFKMFGEHTFLKFTFDVIKNNRDILYDINPIDLIKIVAEDLVKTQKQNMLTVSEILRNNKYKINDTNGAENILTGEEICENPFLFERIKHVDLYKIAYNTGFNHGRQVAKEIIEVASSKRKYIPNNNVVILNRVNKKDN